MDSEHADDERIEGSDQRPPSPPPPPPPEGPPAKRDGLTIRLPKRLLLSFGAVVALGALGAAVYFVLLGGSDTCFSADSGAEVSCDAEGALSKGEYDEQQEQEAEERAEREAAEEKAEAAAAECERQLGDLRDNVRELDSRLSVGLPYDEYSRQVGSIRVAYDQVPFNRLELDCTSEVGIPLEDALNDYVKAGNTWGDCIEDFNCELDSVDPQLQSRWSSAGDNLEDAESGLRGLANP